MGTINLRKKALRDLEESGEASALQLKQLEKNLIANDEWTYTAETITYAVEAAAMIACAFLLTSSTAGPVGLAIGIASVAITTVISAVSANKRK